MNFKPTLWKSVISIILGLLADFVFNYGMAACNVNSNIISCPSVFEFMFWPIGLTIFLTVLILTYIIWSLFQKKR